MLAKYLHAIWKIGTGTFHHCDGAVKGYAATDYPQTPDAFEKASASLDYQKAFRIDRKVPLEDWNEIVGFWFSNPLITDYLNKL